MPGAGPASTARGERGESGREQDDLPALVAAGGLVLLLAAFTVLRLAPLVSHDWPLADGGLFHAMLGDLLAADLALPERVSYQGGVIPFAYPPLAFYVSAAAERLAGVARSDLMRLLPLVATVASVAAMYLLASELDPRRRLALVAAAFFAALISLTDVLFAGGGLTRAPGVLLALLATWQGIRMYRLGRWQDVAATAVLSGLAVLAHPQAGPVVAVALAAAWLTRWRSWRCLGQTALAAGGALLIIAPWVLTVVARHGLDPFRSALAIPDRDLMASLVAYAFLFLLTVPAAGLMDILGQIQQVGARLPHLLVWRAGVFLFDLRYSPVSGAVPVSLLAAHGTLDVLVPATWRLADRWRGQAVTAREQTWLRRLAVSAVLALAFVPSVLSAVGSMRPEGALTEGQRQAMTWVREHTSVDTPVVVLATGRWGSDDVSEWFPALSGRVSATTSQGLEWAGEVHARQLAAEAELDTCRSAAERAGCVAAWVERHLDRTPVVLYVDRSVDGDDDGSRLAADLVDRAGYRRLWSAPDGDLLEARTAP